MSDDSDTAADVRARLNTAIMALRSAQEIVPQRTPFREIDHSITDALTAAIAARTACHKV